MYLQKNQLTSWAFASHSLLSLADSKENQGVHIFKPALDLVDVKIEEKEGAVLEDDENKPIKVKKTKKKYKKHASSLHNGAFCLDIVRWKSNIHHLELLE